ncbi:MAG: hypothetical protein ABSH48_15045 [Verrucomicrobiota bacterium]|jgi:hypothetical protein
MKIKSRLGKDDHPSKRLFIKLNRYSTTTFSVPVRNQVAADTESSKMLESNKKAGARKSRLRSP